MALIKFSDIPVRANGQDIDASWFNSIRTLLVQIFGDISGEEATAIGNTDTNQDITGLVDVSAEDFSGVDIKYMVRRKDDGNDVFQSGTFSLHYKATTDEWYLVGENENINGNDCKIEFSIFTQTLGGFRLVTVRYTTTDLGGGGVHTGDIKVKSDKWII